MRERVPFKLTLPIQVIISRICEVWNGICFNETILKLATPLIDVDLLHNNNYIFNFRYLKYCLSFHVYWSLHIKCHRPSHVFPHFSDLESRCSCDERHRRCCDDSRVRVYVVQRWIWWWVCWYIIFIFCSRTLLILALSRVRIFF